MELHPTENGPGSDLDLPNSILSIASTVAHPVAAESFTTMQSDYFGAAAIADEPENGRVRSRPDSPTPSGPARKVQKRNSIASNGSNEDNKDDDDAAAGDASVDAAGGPMPNGPPFICPTCSTSYSRLEYLRRHERRRE